LILLQRIDLPTIVSPLERVREGISSMAARPSWEGHLRLSLVTCPVALWPATTEARTVRFNMINPQTNNRIRMQTVDAGTGEQVSRATW
jgi:non-homologous end joining protein Ku